jgi:RNA polymerase primary sigma factor/RNA polymerase sigma factor
MHSHYRSDIIKQLCDQQVRFAPRLKKLQQVDRAERLLSEIDPSKTYSYEYLCYRITEYRPELSRQMVLSGEEARHDVRLFVEDVSDAADICAADLPEPVHTVEDLSRIFSVSPKTISRWREQGLVCRKLIFEGGRKRLGFLQSSVDRFVSRNTQRVQRGEQFSHLTGRERSEIIDRARRLSNAGATQSETARRIAKHMNRSVETIRYTLKQFDQKHPDLAIFPDNSGPLSEELKEKIYQDHQRGEPVANLVERYHRTHTSIYRVVNEMRAKRLRELPLDHIYNEEFERPGAEGWILGPMPDNDASGRPPRIPGGLPSYLAALYEVPLLTREQEYHLFRKFNYLKFQADRLRKQLRPARASSALMNRIEQLYADAIQTKNQIVQANLRLVVSIAKRHVSGSDDFFALVSDGNMSLIRAVEKFDYARGNKFSTYASWAIMRNYARTIPDEFKHRDRFRTSQEEAFAAQQDERVVPGKAETAQMLRERQIEKILSRLDEREQAIIISRFGLDRRQEPKTLKEVGSQLGVTKERIRQIEARALGKLRMAAAEECIEIPD